jgi:hypothetical protein
MKNSVALVVACRGETGDGIVEQLRPFGKRLDWLHSVA